MDKDFSETIDIPQNSTTTQTTQQNDVLENVNATYEQMLKDVRKMIKDNNEAAKLE